MDLLWIPNFQASMAVASLALVFIGLIVLWTGYQKRNAFLLVYYGGPCVRLFHAREFGRCFLGHKKGGLVMVARRMITWSSRSRRQLPTQRSATPFCHGQPKAVPRFPCLSRPKPHRRQSWRRGRIARICAAVGRPMLRAIAV